MFIDAEVSINIYLNNCQMVKFIYLSLGSLNMIYRSIILATLLNTVGFASTLNVPEQYSSIQSAINASTDQDTIMVSPGFYQENISFSGRNID